MQEEHSELTSLSSSMESEESPLAYLEMVHQLRERVNALIQAPLPEVPSLHLALRAERFFEEHWSDMTIRGLRDAPVPQISCHTCSTADGAMLRQSFFTSSSRGAAHAGPHSTVFTFSVWKRSWVFWPLSFNGKHSAAP